MNKNTRGDQRWLFFFVLISLLVSSCGPGQFLGPTITPSPTLTFTPTLTITPSPTLTATATITSTATQTPIPGIEAPLSINGLALQIRSAILGIEMPPGDKIASGYETVLLIEMTLTGDGNPADVLLNSVVIDEQGKESQAEEFFFVPVLRVAFAVQKDSHEFSLRLPDGQVMDLMPILEVCQASCTFGS